MPVAVITGCNSGIGHAFAEILIKEGYFVYALDLNAGPPLLGLAGPSCQIGRLDVTDVESIWEFGASIGDKPIDVLLNVAGVMAPPDTDALRTLTLATLQRTFAINTFGPVLLTQALLNNILAAAAPRRVAVVSSRVGSIADNSSGGSYAYRASKSAVNSLFKNLSLELKAQEVVVSILHPGFTKTNLGPNVGSNPESVEPMEAATKLWAVMKANDLEQTGRFWHREGHELPW